MKFIDLRQFKSLRPTGRTTAIRKEYRSIIKQVGAEEDRTLEFCITTDSIDRHGDTVSATGWKTAAYLRNPVVLYSHDYSALPIGKAVSLTRITHGLRSAVKFAPASIHAFAEQVYQLCKNGFINAASVGFIPLAYEEADRDGYYPLDITSAELIEWSIVPVPANGEALRGKSAVQAEISAMRESLGASMETLRRALAAQKGRGATSRSQEIDVTSADLDKLCNDAMDRAGLPRECDLNPEELEVVVNAQIDAYLLNEGSR